MQDVIIIGGGPAGATAAIYAARADLKTLVLDKGLILTQFARRVHSLVQTPELKKSSDLGEEVSQHPKIESHLGARLREAVGEQKV